MKFKLEISTSYEEVEITPIIQGYDFEHSRRYQLEDIDMGPKDLSGEEWFAYMRDPVNRVKIRLSNKVSILDLIEKFEEDLNKLGYV